MPSGYDFAIRVVGIGTVLSVALAAAGVRLRLSPLRIEFPSSDRRFYTSVAVVAYLLWLVAFEVVGSLAATLQTFDLTTRLDRAIPVIPAFVWPYELCYLFPFLPLLVLRDWRRYNAALLAFVLANATAFVLYLLLPIAFPRPTLGSSLSARLLASEYAADFNPGANNLPSMHVAISWIVWLVMRGERGRLLDGVTFVIACAITVSTLFVKQHMVADVAVGMVWGVGWWAIARRLDVRLTEPAASPREALVQLFDFPRWPAALLGRREATSSEP